MTLIEFFDEEIIDNVMGTLLLKPERTILLCKEGREAFFVGALEKILKVRGINTEILTEYIDVEHIERTKAKLEEVIEKYPDCDFDIAGGSDVLLVAIGEVAKKHNLPMHTVDVKRQAVRGINNNRVYNTQRVSLKVSEIVMLYGGKASNEADTRSLFSWNKDEKAEADIEKVWSVCRQDPGAWNSAIGAMKGYRQDRKSVLAMIWSKLKKEGLVRSDGGGVRYKNELVKYLVSKQGTALEMYTYIAAMDTGFFDDGQSGVVIDWKGRREVENEIDVFLTNGAIGYFVSCKNGMVDSDELYKLSTVARRFGGKYAKKILVLSQFEPDNSFMDRADEMGIKVIKNVKHLKKNDLGKRLMG